MSVERSAAPPGPRTIARAFFVLDSFTVDAREWRTTDLARHCGLPVPTTHRILRVLERRGYLIRDPDTRMYRLGPAAASFARQNPALAELRQVAGPVLRAVGSAAGERVVLAAVSESREHGLEISFAGPDHPEAAAPRRVSPTPLYPRIGPLYAGASFKALLAQMPEAELAQVIRRGLDPVGPATITQPERLRHELAAIRRRGWAFSREESAADSWAVAVPVVDCSGARSCALGITAPLERFDRERARQHLSVLVQAARRLTGRLRDEEINQRGGPSCGASAQARRGDLPWQTA